MWNAVERLHLSFADETVRAQVTGVDEYAAHAKPQVRRGPAASRGRTTDELFQTKVELGRRVEAEGSGATERCALIL